MADVKNQLSIYLALKRTQKEVKKSGPVINVFPRKGLKREVELALIASWANFCFRFQQLVVRTQSL